MTFIRSSLMAVEPAISAGNSLTKSEKEKQRASEKDRQGQQGSNAVDEPPSCQSTLYLYLSGSILMQITTVSTARGVGDDSPSSGELGSSSSNLDTGEGDFSETEHSTESESAATKTPSTTTGNREPPARKRYPMSSYPPVDLALQLKRTINPTMVALQTLKTKKEPWKALHLNNANQVHLFRTGILCRVTI